MGRSGKTIDAPVLTPPIRVNRSIKRDVRRRIAHDLAAIRHVSDRIAVMYLGRIVELASAQTIVDRPQHPYTQALLSAVPVPDPRQEQLRQRTVLSGEMPSPINPPAGCPFHTRCPLCEERCRSELPVMRTIETGHQVACHVVN